MIGKLVPIPFLFLSPPLCHSPLSCGSLPGARTRPLPKRGSAPETQMGMTAVLGPFHSYLPLRCGARRTLPFRFLVAQIALAVSGPNPRLNCRLQ